jgi:hypothetical protein
MILGTSELKDGCAEGLSVGSLVGSSLGGSTEMSVRQVGTPVVG